jgi:hypothetical protein
MARPFNNQYIGTKSAKKDFGQFLESQDAGDYILNKAAKTTYCIPNKCTPSIKVGSQNNYLLYKKSNNLTIQRNCLNSINKSNLNINLITKLNLKDIPVIEDFSGNKVPSNIIDSNLIIPYLEYNVDPKGLLFGNTLCGADNFLRYLEYNSPYSSISDNNVSTQNNLVSILSDLINPNNITSNLTKLNNTNQSNNSSQSNNNYNVLNSENILVESYTNIILPTISKTGISINVINKSGGSININSGTSLMYHNLYLPTDGGYDLTIDNNFTAYLISIIHSKTNISSWIVIVH